MEQRAPSPDGGPGTPGEAPPLRRTPLGHQVRHALARLHDLSFLQTHPLGQVLQSASGAGRSTAGQVVQQRLLDAVEQLRPSPETPPASRAWRSYRLLALRYIEGADVAEVCAQLGISLREYSRSHSQALEAVVSLLHAGLAATPAVPWTGTGRDGAAEPSSSVAAAAGRRTGSAGGVGQGALGLLPVHTPLVGRGEELAFLRAQYEAVAAGGGGRLVLAYGEPGVGKTRLARELGRHAAALGGNLLEGRHLRDSTVPYAPWVEILRALLRDAGRAELGEAAGPYGPELCQVLPELAEVLRPSAPSPQLTPDEHRLRLYDGIARLLITLSHRRPLVVLLDDLQWAPGLSLLSHLARRLLESNLLVVGAYREQEFQERPALVREQAELHRARLFVPLALRPLEEAQTLEMMAQTFGEEVAAQLGGAVHRRARGNPFFVEEVLRSLVQGGAVRPGEGGWEVAEVGQIHIPESVKLLVEERLARLGKGVREVLALAAVLGQEFGLATLGAVARVDEERLLVRLEHAVGVRLLADRSRPGEERFEFVDDQVQEVLYGNLPGVRRRRLHLRAGQALEGLYGGEAEPHVEDLARHFTEGHAPEQGAQYAYRAGEKAERLFVWPQALSWYQSALAQWERAGGHLPERAAVCERMGDLCWRSGVDVTKGWGHIQQALALYEQLGDRPKQAELHLLLGREHMWSGSAEHIDLQKAVEHLEVARDILEAAGPSVPLGHVYNILCIVCGFIGQPVRALAWGNQAMEVGTQLNDAALIAYARVDVAMCHIFTGHLAEGLEMIERAWSLAAPQRLAFEIDYSRQVGILASKLAWTPRRATDWAARQPHFETSVSVLNVRLVLTPVYALLGELDEGARVLQEFQGMLAAAGQSATRFFPDHAGQLLLYRGEWEAARNLLEEGAPWAIGVHNLWMAAMAKQRLGQVCLELGQNADAEEHLCWALDCFRGGGYLVHEVDLLPHLCALYARTGRVEQATRHLEEAQAILARPQEWYGLAGGVHRAEGLVRAAQGRWAEAEAGFQRAVAVDREYELRWDEARVYYEWACALLGKREQGARNKERAQELLEKAGTMWEQMGAGPYTERCRTKLAELA